MYKNNDIRLELSRLARIVDHKMKIQGDVVFKCENVATLDPISFETPEAYISLPKWNTKRMGSISFDFRTSEPNGLILFTHGKPQDRKVTGSQKNTKVDFFAVELLDGSLYLLLDMGSGTIKVKATQNKVNDGTWYHVDIQRDGRSGQCVCYSSVSLVYIPAIHFVFLIKTKSSQPSQLTCGNTNLDRVLSALTRRYAE